MRISTDHRLQLEGAAEVLEGASERALMLSNILGEPRRLDEWRRLRPLLRRVVEEQAHVRAALTKLQRLQQQLSGSPRAGLDAFANWVDWALSRVALDEVVRAEGRLDMIETLSTIPLPWHTKLSWSRRGDSLGRIVGETSLINGWALLSSVFFTTCLCVILAGFGSKHDFIATVILIAGLLIAAIGTGLSVNALFKRAATVWRRFEWGQPLFSDREGLVLLGDQVMVQGAATARVVQPELSQSRRYRIGYCRWAYSIDDITVFSDVDDEEVDAIDRVLESLSFKLVK